MKIICKRRSSTYLKHSWIYKVDINTSFGKIIFKMKVKTKAYTCVIISALLRILH